VSTQTKRKWMSQNEREMKKSDQTNQSASDSLFFSARPPFSRCPVFYITPFPPHYYIASSFSHPFEQWDVIGQRLFLFSLVRLNQGLACHQEKKEMNDPWKVVTIVGSREFRVCATLRRIYIYISPDVVYVQVECAQRHTPGPPSADTHGIDLTPLFRTSM
jgi:hypothetical protein